MTLRLCPFDPAAHARLVSPLAQLWLDSWRSTGTASEEDIRVEDLEARIREEAATVWEVTLAFQGDALAGFLALRPHDACLDQLFMAPAAKGQGIGSRLIDLAKQRLADGMWLRTAADNRPARAFYEKRGFRHTETDEHPRLKYARVIYRWP
ncbi:MAG TPA: GNAT family N-acetyltransferase [Caulobacter sp.]|nr:GNAT family N-acetyltransferase [Caulobacter sp.]